jgi:hypothetical protein
LAYRFFEKKKAEAFGIQKAAGLKKPNPLIPGVPNSGLLGSSVMTYRVVLRQCPEGAKLGLGNRGHRPGSANSSEFTFLRDLPARISFIDCMDDFDKEQSPSLDNNGKVDSLLGSL